LSDVSVGWLKIDPNISDRVGEYLSQMRVLMSLRHVSLELLFYKTKGRDL